VEHVIVGVWAADPVTGRQIVDAWAGAALGDERVERCVASFAVADQPYRGDPVSAVLALGLARAHDLDDVPARATLHRGARRVEIWRVDPRTPKVWDRTWPDGTEAPGVKMVSFMRRAEGLSHEQFVRHWTERHTPLALAHHPGLWNYTQNVVRRALTVGGEGIDGIAELHFASRDDYETRFFDSDDGRAVIMDDVRRFMAPPGPETALMVEVPLRTS
jgi:uncharacterized protein (TIGR02118 family)